MLEGVMVGLLVLLATSLALLARSISTAVTSTPPVAHRCASMDGLADLVTALANQSSRIDDLTLAIDVGIKEVNRVRSRVEKTVTSARRAVRETGIEHAGIEVEYEELLDGDESHGEGERVPEVLPVLASPDIEYRTGIPGLNSRTLEAMDGVSR